MHILFGSMVIILQVTITRMGKRVTQMKIRFSVSCCFLVKKNFAAPSVFLCSISKLSAFTADNKRRKDNCERDAQAAAGNDDEARLKRAMGWLCAILHCKTMRMRMMMMPLGCARENIRRFLHKQASLTANCEKSMKEKLSLLSPC